MIFDNYKFFCKFCYCEADVRVAGRVRPVFVPILSGVVDGFAGRVRLCLSRVAGW